MKTYAGIGSRKTPEPILGIMRMIGNALAHKGYTLRSGHARGPDTAFETAAAYAGGLTEIYRPENVRPEWLEHASHFHPNWPACTYEARMLHARNSAIVLGPELNDRADFIVCWTPAGAITGGTGQALRIAARYGITVYNLALDPEGIDFFSKVCR